MTIRFKLTTVVIAIILIANSLLSVVVLQYLGHVWLQEVQKRVRRNLNSARSAYVKRTELMAALLQGAAFDGDLKDAVARQDHRQMRQQLQAVHQSGSIDFLLLLDTRGRVLCRAANDRVGEDLSGDPLVARARLEKHGVQGNLIYTRERLLAEGDELAERARFELIPTPAARPSSETERSDGLVLAAAVPMLDGDGRVLSVLYGGMLVNRRFEIVDAIKAEVFPHETYRGKDIGTVTIFQGDLRIATNVTMDDGSRAIGTRLSASVCDVVLDRGDTWAAPAFVVNDWYITAYEPIRDPDGAIIGSLYVGLLQAPFAHQWNVISGVFLGVVVAATAASLILLVIANELVLGPIRRVVQMAQKVIGGDLSARVGIRPPGEMGTLCWAIDSMAHAVAEREELMQSATRQQIGRSEQLASVGRLAAGVAHEINNPLVGVLTFADMLRMKPNLDDQDRSDLDVIIRETKRVREIVKGLLDYARETPSIKKQLDVNEVIRHTLLLLGKREAFQHIYVVEDLGENLPPIWGDKSQLQQVVMNLVLNACEAMAEGGTLVVASSAAGENVRVQVTDTGCGIKRENLDRIFEPFFTTKPVGKGTGLGLAVSYGILQQHGGTLNVQSEVGRGTTFTITLPPDRTTPTQVHDAATAQTLGA